MGKENLLFKLDQLQYQLEYLNGTIDSFKPRFKQTSQFFDSKSRKIDKKRSKLLNNANKVKLEQDIIAISLKFLDQKIHHVVSKLHVNLIRNKLLLENEQVKEIGTEKFVQYITYSKVVKLTASVLGGSKNLPKWFRNHEFFTYLNDKDQELNPSRIYNEIFLKYKLNALNSKLLNDKKTKELLASFENGIHILLNEKEKVKKEVKEGREALTASKESSSEPKEKTVVEAIRTQDEVPVSKDELDSEQEDIIMKQYNGLLAASDDESEGDFQLDPSIDYNQVTDEEPSEDEDRHSELDDGSEDETDRFTNKKQKLGLPELATGYYSGDEDESFEDDDMFRDEVSEKPKRKNRRGQRARQKIWEKKYGKQAKHIQREVEKERAERERKRLEFEERQAKREAKAAKAAEIHGNSHFDKFAQPKQSDSNAKASDKPLHPSWEAKKIAEEKQKNVKFQGKKITFN